MPNLAQAAGMNRQTYGRGDGSEALEQQGWCVEDVTCCPANGCTVTRWRSKAGYVYLAVRGSANALDLAEDIAVFLGQPPHRRIAFLEGYLLDHCKTELLEGRLAVGGHSLGGMIAMGAAATWRLPALVQNAPGWLVDPPSAESLGRVVELRTAGDVVGMWGHPVPCTLVLRDPTAAGWSLARRHSAGRQAELIEQAGLGAIALDDRETLEAVAEASASVSATSTWGWMARTWRAARAEIQSTGIERADPPSDTGTAAMTAGSGARRPTW